MRFIRRAGGLAVAAVLLSGFVSGATAATVAAPETYLGSAAGRALNLRVGSTQLSSGSSSALVNSDLKAVGEGIGALGLPIVGGNNAGVAEVVGSGSKINAKSCASPAVPAPLSTVVNIKAACSSSLAEILEAGPHAIGTGTVSEVDVELQTVLDQVISNPQVKPVLDTVFSGLDSNALINAVNNTVPGANLQVGSTLSEVVKALGTVRTLEVRLGQSVSEVTTEGAKVTSSAKAAGGVISILPLGAAGLKPVAEIVIGSSSATAVYDRATGVSTPAFDPSIVTIRINTPTTDNLGKLTGINFNEIKIGPELNLAGVLPTVVNPQSGLPLATKCADAANEYCVLPGTPFETRIAIASGRTVTNADGSVGAVADAVKIHALKNIQQLASTALNGGVLLELAHTEAGVGGTPAKTVVDVPQLDTPRELPRTGGTPWLPIVGGGALVLAVAGRRALVRSH